MMNTPMKSLHINLSFLGLISLVTTGFAKVPKAELVDLWKKSARGPSTDELLKRADYLESMGLFVLAQKDAVDSFKERSASVQALERAAGLALRADRYESFVAAVNAYRQRGGSIADHSSQLVLTRVALAAFQFSIGQMDRAYAFLPDANEIQNKIQSPVLRGKAFYVLGVIQSLQGKLNEAAEAFRRSAELFDQTKYGDVAQSRLQRARLLYERNKFEEVFNELLQVPKSATSWYPGVLVSAWSAYKVKDYNLALGQLMTLHSPHLRTKFAPESFIIESASFYKLCYYESAKRSIKELRTRYEGLAPVIRSLKKRIDVIPYDQLVSNMHAYAQDGSGSGFGIDLGIAQDKLNRILDGVLADPALLRIDRNLTSLDHEAHTLSSLATDLESNRYQMRLLDNYKRELTLARREQHKAYVDTVGRRLNEMAQDVDESLENALAVDLEINTQLRSRLLNNQSSVIKEIDFEKEIRKGFEFWPYEGEFWKDEVGNYLVATSDACSQGERR